MTKSNFRLALIIIILNSSLFLKGQSASWNYRVNSGNLGTTYSWIDCTDGTEFLGYNGNHRDDGYWEVDWPFDFTYYDDTYTSSDKLYVCTNGFFRFDGIPDYANYSDAENYVLDKTPSHDFGQVLLYGISDAYFKYSDQHAYYKVTGTAPNRIFTFEFVNFSFYSEKDASANMQVSFYESTNHIVIKTGQNTATHSGAEIGLHSGVPPYFHYWQDIDNSSENTWVEYVPTVATSNDQTSYARSPASQPSVTDFPTSATGTSNAHEVLSFKIIDPADGDGVPTKVSKIRIKNAHPGSEADWTDCISGVVLNNGTSDLNVGVTTIDDEYIDFIFNIDEFDIPDGSTTDLTLKIFLTPGAPIEGEKLQFYIDDDDHDWFHDQLGSGFLANFGNASDITSNVFTFVTTASELRFTVNPPSTVLQDNVVSPTVTVSAVDPGGNVDANYTGTITLSNSGNISWNNNVVTAVNGVAEFTNLTFTTTGGPVTITTSNADGLSEATSTETTVAYKTVLFSDDFEDPTQSQNDWTASGTSNIWEVGNQTNGSYGPSSGHSANGVYGTKLNDDYGQDDVDAYLDCPIIDLAGTGNPKVKFWMDMESENTYDGGTVQIRVKEGSNPWGAFITIDMGDTGYSGEIPNDDDVDGLDNNEHGWSGDQPSGDWAEVIIDLFNLTTSGLDNISASSLIQVRFWFGTDANTNAYPGWYIDDFEISNVSYPGLWSTAASTTDWATASNWDDGNVPSDIFVTIPSGATNYPLVDETASASTILVQDGGELRITTGASLSLSGDLTVGEGISGLFAIDDGTCTITGNIYTNTGSGATFSGGTTSFANWAKSNSEELAEGTIDLSGGTTTASGDVKFTDANLNGSMSGDFVMNIGSDFSISDNVWSTPTGGTINLNGSSAATIDAQNANAITAYNLQIANSAGVSMASNATIENKLDVLAVSKLTIENGTSLTVSGDMTLRADDKQRAILIDYENLTVSGASNAEIYTSANKFHYLSSPLSVAPTTTFSVAPWGDTNPNFYYFDESDPGSNWFAGWLAPPAGNLEVGKGYAYLLTSNHTHTLTGGNFNTGNISVAVANSNNGGAANSWNLIGNPYPSPIDADAFIQANSDADETTGLLTGTLYFWDDDASDGSDYSTSDYATYNRAGAVGGGNGTTVNGSIAIGQGFFVKANFNGNVSFTNSMRTPSSANFFKSTAKPVHQKLRLSIENTDKDYNEILIAFISDATDEFDNLYDGAKIKGNSNIAFYSLLNNEAMAIQSFAPIDPFYDESKEIPIGFTAGKSGIHRIKLKLREDINSFYKIYIKDLYNDTEDEITLEDYFEFTTEQGTFDNRFVVILRTNKTTTSVNNLNKSETVSIYSTRKTIYVVPAEAQNENARVVVYNIAGSIIFDTDIKLLSRFSHELNAIEGLYIVKVITESGTVYTNKVYIK